MTVVCKTLSSGCSFYWRTAYEFANTSGMMGRTDRPYSFEFPKYLRKYTGDSQYGRTEMAVLSKVWERGGGLAELSTGPWALTNQLEATCK